MSHATVRRHVGLSVGVMAATVAALLSAVPAGAAPSDQASDVAHYWTAERVANAVPRDLVVDPATGRGNVRDADGQLRPVPQAKPDGAGNGGGKPGGGGDDTTDATGPSVGLLNPAEGAVIGASQTFTATVTDPSGVKSVDVVVSVPTGSTPQTLSATQTGADTWSITLQGLTDGAEGSWHVVATDATRKGGNTTTSDPRTFRVDTGADDGDGGGGSTGDVVTNAEWVVGGDVQEAAGRLYFEMPTNRGRKTWNGYVCSGTVVQDGVTGRSVVLTAAHCVYDDATDTFARNVLFIPNQDGTTGPGTDSVCSNDPLGCWAPSFGVVHAGWDATTFPANIPYDYAYYVVPDADAHTDGAAGTSTADALDVAVPAMPTSFGPPTLEVTATALGYSYSDDPNFMYCEEPLDRESQYGDLWLPSCGLSGGASGGPWLQSAADGTDVIVSVNSWGYTDQPGMGGPRLDTTSAACTFAAASTQAFDGRDGIVTDCT